MTVDDIFLELKRTEIIECKIILANNLPYLWKNMVYDYKLHIVGK